MAFVEDAMRLWTMAAFMAYSLIWIMMPTYKFNHTWLPFLISKTYYTYLGSQGGYIFLYALPVFSLAILGCFSIHLLKENTINSSQRWESWKRPIITKGPLGIVSWTELSFSAMFIGLLLWSFTIYLHEMFSNISGYEAAPLWEIRVENTGMLLGLIGNISLSFLFFPVARGSPILHLVGLTSESSIKYHIWLAHITLILFAFHSICYIIVWLRTHQLSHFLKWQKIGPCTIAAEISFLSGLLMWTTSFTRIRRKFFELFFYTHQLYILFVIFFVFHVGFSYACIMLPSFYLFLIDRYLRFLQSQRQVRLVSAKILPCEAVELNFSKSKNLHYTPTSIVFVNVPEISKLQWHPFTITSSSLMDSERVSVVINNRGRWSEKLYRKLATSNSPDRLEVSVEGPYGPASINLCRHEMVVMICGGSGITPFIAIIRELIFISNTQKNKALPRIQLICVFKRSLDLAMLDLILPDSGAGKNISGLQIQIQAYVTGENEHAIEDPKQKLIKVLFFKPSASDTPFSASLGSNNYLWLSITIGFSFFTFLLFLGILTRFYIYPADKNSKSAVSDPMKDAVSMMCVFSAIVVPATATFMWKKKETMNEKCSEIGEEEPEIFPDVRLVKATQVHYGQRPNFKRILTESGKSEARVLVSGPRKMRQEVAELCSSNPFHHFHFESISFTW